MSDSTPTNPEQTDNLIDPHAEHPTAEQQDAQPPTAELSEVDQLKERIAELEDKELRIRAELRNQQQRFDRERADALKYAHGDIAKDLLTVLDNFERTLESAAVAQTAEDVAGGARLVYDEFLKVLAGRQIQQIEAVGQPFDPTLHEAMLQQPSDDVPAGGILQEVAKGYRMHDRVLRAARVIVSSGPATADASAQAEG